MTPSTSLSPAAIAMNRFGLGARPDDTIPADPKAWLKGQLGRFQPATAAFTALPDAGELVQTYLDEQRQLRQQAKRDQAAASMSGGGKSIEQKAARRDYAQDVQALYRQAVQARAQAVIDTPAPFVERLVHFWSNHFCVSADNQQVTAFAGAFERDAIRPHVLGRFEDMLLAVEHHPAMLIYLNQIQSIGPDSMAAERAARRNPAQRRGLNENLGREIMELHTLGVRSGYSQSDVTEFARALTGWSVAGIGPGGATDDRPGEFLFRPQLHEPGERTILGKRYREDGEAQARAALTDFARSPATATHVATKLARHFAGDAPPPALVERLAASFRRSGGDLPALYRTLIDSPEPWQPAPLKFKTPWEWTISALRGLGRSEIGAMQVAAIQNQLGQPVWKPGSPAGWDDVAASWAGPDALLRRVDFAQRLVAPVGDRLDARQLGPRLLPASFSRATADEVGRAESPGDALALLLVSPDFLRR
ncbi:MULTISPECIES: DUF1800 domain-containing protein [unclassified Sphingomonas]|uniref:DUF1800 domain-containing protein n=1 Tax=unclassified Sphingomonas TaxID=196159 RepID=UPI00092BB1EB|nr:MULTISPECIES: DUF1800 domain-containing protein [unclassified Sphingomonas]OJV34176.1 MAG: hypothetical protein BGO24_13520 [Sphingomonas sp. 67-36]